MQHYKVTKSVTINGFKVDPTRSSQHFCPSLTMSANPSSSLFLLTRAGHPGWFAVLSQMLSCQSHIQLCTWRGTDGCDLGLYTEPPHVQLFPGYFPIQILTVRLTKFQRMPCSSW